jgi:hypothetical protein
MTTVLEQTDELVVTEGVRIILMVEVAGEGFCLFIEEVQSVAISGYPEILLAVDVDITDVISTETGGIARLMMVVIEPSAVRLEVNDSLVFGAHPDITGRIFCQAGDEVTGDGGAARIFSECQELVLCPVVPVEPSSTCSYPYITTAVFNDVGDEVITETAFVPEVVAIDIDLVAVIFVETVPGTEPYEPPAVLEDTKDIVLGEACIDVQVFELKAWLLCSGGTTQQYCQRGSQELSFDRLGYHALGFRA